MEFYLEHLTGGQAGSFNTFKGVDVIRVGRNEDYELPFDDLGVSYDHAELRVRNGFVWLVDRGSTNGSYLNGEKAHNSKLREGDILRFGKKGPELKVRLRKPRRVQRAEAEAARKAAGAEPAPAEPSAEAERASRRRATEEKVAVMPASSGRNEAVPPAPEVPRPRERDLRRPTESHDAVQPARSSASGLQVVTPVSPSAGRGGGGGSKAPFIITFALLVASLGVCGFLFLQWLDTDERLVTKRGQVKKLEYELREMTDELSETRKTYESKLAVIRDRSAGHRDRIARLEADRKREKDLWDRRNSNLLADIRRRDDRINQLKKQLEIFEKRSESGGGSQVPDRILFQRILKRFNQAVVLVFNQLKGRTPDGRVIDLSNSGTGFFINRHGHIVTNKHVIQPWKFPPLATRIAKEGIEIDPASHHVTVWIAGSRFRKRNGALDRSTGFSTLTDTLKIDRVAQDQLYTMSITDKSSGPRSIKVHSLRSNNDVAVLKVTRGGPFISVVPHGPNDLPVERLDPVMVLGFPMGVRILERSVAETAPTTGSVRKIEDSIWISATMQPGNSGGPLFDRAGRVVGISTRIMKGSDSLGSCIKIEHALKLLGGTW